MTKTKQQMQQKEDTCKTKDLRLKDISAKKYHPPWVPSHTYEYCDGNPNTKAFVRTPKEKTNESPKMARQEKCTEQMAQTRTKTAISRKSRLKLQHRKNASSRGCTVQGNRNRISVKNIDEDEDLDEQAVALQSYLTSLDAHSVKVGAKDAANFNCYTIANEIINSGASATFVTSTSTICNATNHKTQLRIN